MLSLVYEEKHHSLLTKLADLQLPDSLRNCIIQNFANRQHSTKIRQTFSAFPINTSIIHGSGMGPVEYVCTASDLRAILLTMQICR